MASPTFDVCVVGAGLAGLAAARELARTGASVAILSLPLEPDGFKVGESLPGSAVVILRRLGLEFLLAETGQGASPGTLSAWGTKKLTATDFIASPHGSGWHLDRTAFELAMFREVQRSGVSVFGGRFAKASRHSGNWIVYGQQLGISADWIIDATGRRAHFACSQGAVRNDDNGQLAVVRWFRAERDDADMRTLVESSEHGWWYSSRLPNDVRVVTFHGEGSRIIKMYRDIGAWELTLAATNHIRHRVRGSPELAKPKLVQACGSCLDHACGQNWLAAGDAALAFDPISSQGMFSALDTGLRAARAIIGQDSLEHYALHLRSIRNTYVVNVTRAYGEVMFTNHS